MANGQWVKIGPREKWFCHNCGDYPLQDQVYETDKGTYCCEGCADDAESHDDSLNSGLVCDYPD